MQVNGAIHNPQVLTQQKSIPQRLLKTIKKVSSAVLNVLRSVFMLPIISLEALINGSKIEFFGKESFKVWDEIPPEVKQRYEAFAQSSMNEVVFSPSGPSSLEWKEKMIRNAKYSLEISGSYCGGKPFDRFLELFEEKLKTNDQIVIRVLASPAMLSNKQLRKVKRLEELYKDRFELVKTCSTWQVFPKVKMKENHPKMLVADQKYFVVGGNNVTNWQLSEEELEKINYKGTMGQGHYLDIDVAGKGAMADKLKSQFDALWGKWKTKAGKQENGAIDKGFNYKNVPDENRASIQDFDGNAEKLKGECSLHIGSAEQGKDNVCEKKYVEMIRSAEKTIYISNMLFNQKRIIQELKEAIQRGVNVEVLTNGDGMKLSIGARMQGSRNLLKIKPLFQASHQSGAGSFKLSVQKKRHQFLHTKAIVVDEETFAIGSFNIDKKSTRCDDEILLVFKSEQIAKRALKHLEELKKSLVPLTEKDLRSGYVAASRVFGFFADRAMRHIL